MLHRHGYTVSTRSDEMSTRSLTCICSLEDLTLKHVTCFLSAGNLRLQEMMGVMCEERGAKLFATDER